MGTTTKILLYTSIPFILASIVYVIGGGDTAVTKNLVIKSLFYLSCIYFIGSFGYMSRNILRNYSFSSLGSQFDVVWWEFWKQFGLKRSDYMKFNIDIRTKDASDDCRIKGKYKVGKLSDIHIHGSGEDCTELRNNNKL